MRPRPLATLALALAVSAVACQLIWTYDGDQPGVGGSSSSSTRSSTSAGSTSGSAGSTSASSSSGSACFTSGSSSSGDAGCPNGAAPTGMACTDCCDETAIAANRPKIQGDVETCTLASGDHPACIAMAEGISMACAGCWATLGDCGVMYCSLPCGANVDSPECNHCLGTNCDCAFKACSGIRRPAALDGGADGPCD